MTFDASNSCAASCSPFDLLLANYGSIAGVSVTNGILSSFGSSGAFSDGMHWYDGNPTFSGGFTIGVGAVGAFVFTTTDPLATIRFDQVLATSNAANTATFDVYSLSNTLLASTSSAVNANVVTTFNGPVSAVGGFKLEFDITPGALSTLEVDNLEYTLLGTTGSPQSVTPGARYHAR